MATGHEQATPAVLSPEDQSTLRQALPLLQHLRDNERTAEGYLPANSAVHSGEYVSILPYYMKTADTPELGMWKIKVGDSLEARVQTLPSDQDGDDGMVCKFKVKDSDGVWRAATLEEAHDLTSVIGVVDASSVRSIEPVVEAQKPETKGLLSHLGSLVFRHKAAH